MYQGVPTVTRRTEERHGQVGADLLAAVGLPDLVAGDDAEYVRIATALATDLDRLRSLRTTLRARMAPLLDGKPLARRLEAMYRDRVSGPRQEIVGGPKTSTLTWAMHGAAGVARAVTGTGGADAEMIAARTKVCEGCDQAQVVAGLIRTCKLCGCGVWAKVRNTAEKCPLGKW
jgi:hypothetical protein